jgi:hypothetical protein
LTGRRLVIGRDKRHWQDYLHYSNRKSIWIETLIINLKNAVTFQLVFSARFFLYAFQMMSMVIPNIIKIGKGINAKKVNTSKT